VRIRRHPVRIFFDSSCLIAAARSANGGAALVLSECWSRRLQAYASSDVLDEATRNITAKMGIDEMARFASYLQLGLIRVVSTPEHHENSEWPEGINQKDKHVVQSALWGNCQFVLTFDRELAQEINAASLGLVACQPEAIILQFIRRTLP
jgi:predicted nucleic acid-binding protein